MAKKELSTLFDNVAPNKNVELFLGERHELDDLNDDVGGENEPLELQLPETPVQPKVPAITLDTAYGEWTKARTPQAMGQILTAAAPAIDKAVRYYTGSSDSMAIGYARRLVAESLDRYDPSKSSLSTYINRQLQPIVRWNAKRAQGARIPERLLAEHGFMVRAEEELTTELGRAPSIDELADRVGVPVKKIVKLKAGLPSVLTGGMQIGEDDGEAVTAEDLPVENDTTRQWANYVRDSLSDIDKVILDHTLGLNGAAPMSNMQIAQKLRISAAAVSQRKARIQSYIDRGSDLSPFK